MRVKHKVDEEIEALQFDGSEKCAETIIEKFGTEIKKNHNRQGVFVGQLCAASPTGTKFVYKDDYIVSSSKVGISVLKPDLFNALFEEMEMTEKPKLPEGEKLDGLAQGKTSEDQTETIQTDGTDGTEPGDAEIPGEDPGN